MLRNPHLASPRGRGSARYGGFTWIYLSVARLAACLCYGRQVHLSACVPHAQAGRMSMDVIGLVLRNPHRAYSVYGTIPSGVMEP